MARSVIPVGSGVVTAGVVAAVFPAVQVDFIVAFYSLALFHRNCNLEFSARATTFSSQNDVYLGKTLRGTNICFVIEANVASINFNSICSLTLANSGPGETIKVLIAFRVLDTYRGYRYI